MSSEGEQPKLLCLLQSREAALLLPQPHWEVFFPLTLQQMRRQELCSAWGMQHSVQDLAGGRGCGGSAADGHMTRGAQSISGVLAWSVMPFQQCFSLAGGLAQGRCR